MRDRIMDAALAVLVEAGHAETTTRAIAERAGCSEGSIYRHFRDKDDLLGQVASRGMPGATAAAAELPSLAGETEVEATLSAFGAGVLRDLAAGLPVLGMLLAEPRVRAVAREVAPLSLVAGVEAFLFREQKAGRIAKTADVKAGARLFIGALVVQGAMLAPVGGEERFAQDAARTLIAGLQPRA